jgi:4-hydroxybenzoate polyprenyltransferase
MNIIKLLRPHQYIKNLFVFAPLLFSFNFELDNCIGTFLAFILFSIIASSVYILNDLFDIEADRKHPVKKFRPLALGVVSKNTARTLIIVLSSISLIAALFINYNLLFVLSVYFAVNVAYSVKLKHFAIIDIFIIATGFVLRLFAGKVMIDAPLSMWLIIMTFLLALFLAIAKRRDDVLIEKNGGKSRKSISGYNLEFVNITMALMAAVIIVSYILYTVSIGTLDKFQTEYIYLTSFFVILGILRYMQITFVEEKSGNPTKIFFKDRFLQITILLWLISFIVAVKI